LKILYATDLHGNRDRYRAIEELASREGVRAVVYGGDLLPRGPDIRRTQLDFVEEVLAPHIAALHAAGIHFLGILGNDDLRACDRPFEAACARFPTAHPLAGRVVALEGFEFLGFDLVSDTPFRLKDRCRRDRPGFVHPALRGPAVISKDGGFQEIPDWPAFAGGLPTIEEELARLPAPADPSRAVCVIHVPPTGLGLDRCADGREGGSRAVHTYLRRLEPRLSLHGHIHEAPEVTHVWCTRLGRTLVIQPGSRPDLLGVVIDLESRITSLKTRG
jgi:uncharacterized protein